MLKDIAVRWSDAEKAAIVGYTSQQALPNHLWTFRPP